jgi:hypothetical protein
MIKENSCCELISYLKIDLQSYMTYLKLNNRYELRDYC